MGARGGQNPSLCRIVALSVHEAPKTCRRASHSALLSRKNDSVSNWRHTLVSWMTGSNSPRRNGVLSVTASSVGSHYAVGGVIGRISSRMSTLLKHLILWRTLPNPQVRLPLVVLIPQRKKARRPRLSHASCVI